MIGGVHSGGVGSILLYTVRGGEEGGVPRGGVPSGGRSPLHGGGGESTKLSYIEGVLP